MHIQIAITLTFQNVSGSVEHTHSTHKNILKDRTKQRDPGDLKKTLIGEQLRR